MGVSTILTKSMKAYVMSPDKTGYSKEVQNVYNNRLRTYANQAIKDLALIAQNLPEDQQQQIFNHKNLYPLYRGLFEIKYKDNYEPKEYELKQKRILKNCLDAMSIIGFKDNAWNLAPDVMKILISTGLRETFDTFIYLKGIFIKAFNQPQM